LALAIGLLLTPLGAAIGSLLFFTAIALWSGTAGRDEFIGMTLYGLIPGLIFAAPANVGVLPLAHAVLRRRGRLSVRRLTITAAIFGFAAVTAVVLWLWWSDDGKIDAGFWLLALGVAMDGAFAGAICGNLFARMMRGARPEPWR